MLVHLQLLITKILIALHTIVFYIFEIFYIYDI